jgi:hypothetical protein
MRHPLRWWAAPTGTQPEATGRRADPVHAVVVPTDTDTDLDPMCRGVAGLWRWAAVCPTCCSTYVLRYGAVCHCRVCGLAWRVEPATPTGPPPTA